MKPQHWPLYGLRLRTPRLEPRLPDLELLDGLAPVAAVRGAPVTLQRLRMDRARREECRSVEVTVGGLGGCRGEFGA
ncbi:hypothetical protein OG978_15020 [Streptomyces sp. NBC_01591]|uniref:hypothetical protein n=1 Tax=Streptomyces sp. NBC_01591 TaxID=2975888 RepID=UPI002DDA9B2F|nr:hypothetical protein [Streptomyces sp. NBC_01591]WSD68602.1 hypothetical protein OG978_15020 [Streptomyces sp. NBC_01591]